LLDSLVVINKQSFLEKNKYSYLTDGRQDMTELDHKRWFSKTFYLITIFLLAFLLNDLMVANYLLVAFFFKACFCMSCQCYKISSEEALLKCKNK